MCFSWLFVLIPKGKIGASCEGELKEFRDQSHQNSTGEETKNELEIKLQQFLSQNMIKISMHQSSEDMKYSLVTFCMPTSQVDEGLRKLQMYNIGIDNRTSISVISPSLYLPFQTDISTKGITEFLILFGTLLPYSYCRCNA